MDNRFQKFLPIGTVVLLKGAKKRLMIAGFCAYDEENKNKVYDYTGCLYPEGIISSREMALFDHSQIDKIYYLGLQDQEEKAFKQKLINKITQDTNKQKQINTQQNNINSQNNG